MKHISYEWLNGVTRITGLFIHTGVTGSSGVPDAITGAAEGIPGLSAPSSMFAVIGQTSGKQDRESLA